MWRRSWRIGTFLAVAILIVSGFVGYSRINAPGVIPASGCRVGAVMSTDAYTTTGFSQSRTVGPNDEAPAGMWVIADDTVPSFGVVASPNCTIVGGTNDGHPLNVVALELTPTIGSWQQADIQELKLIRDMNCNGLFEDGLDLTMQTVPASQLPADGSFTYFFGPQSSIFNIQGPPQCGMGAVGIMVVVEIGPNPTSESMFGLSLEALAADVPGAPGGGIISSGFSSSRNPAGSSIRLQIVGGQGGGGTTPPPGGGGSSIAAELQPYDANGNDRLEDGEFLNTINDWVDRQLSDSAFFAAIDIWINQSSIAAASVSKSVSRVQMRTTSRGVRFSAMEASSLSVEVFSLDGQRVFHDATSGSTLSWDLRTQHGAPAANGVYLYRTTITTADGQTVRGDVRKLLIQR